MNNRGMELAINFFVTLILTLVVLGMGIYLARGLFSASYDITQQSFDEIDDKTDSLFCQGNIKVCIGRDTITLTSNHYVFTLHLVNAAGEDKTFTLIVEAGPWFDSDGTKHDASTNPLLYLPHNRQLYLKNTEEASIGIAVQRVNSMEKGTYTLGVEVRTNELTYGGKQRLYVKLT